MLRLATNDDIEFIMALERQDENPTYLAQSTRERLEGDLKDPQSCILILLDEAGTPIGFASLYTYITRMMNLQRLAVSTPGQGHGKAFMSEIIRFVFEAAKAHKLYLSVIPENARARHVYETAGFQYEGLQRQHWDRGEDDYVDIVQYGLLRSDPAVQALLAQS